MPEPYQRPWSPNDPLPPESAADINPDLQPRCPECGYILYRAVSTRCPECGTFVYRNEMYEYESRATVRRRERRRRILSVVGGLALLAGMVLAVIGGHRIGAMSACVLGPLSLLTILVLGARVAYGGSAHITLTVFGLLWLGSGVFLVCAR